MSAALEEGVPEGVPDMETLRKQGIESIKKDIAEEVEAGRMKTPKQRRKRKEVKRRRVVNLPDDYSWWLETNLERLGFNNVPQALRELSLTGLEAQHAVSTKEIRLAYRRHEAEKILAEIEAEEREDG